MSVKVNVLKFRTLYSIQCWPIVCFLCSCFLKYLAEWQIVKIQIRLEQSDLSMHYLHVSFCQKFGVRNFRMFTVMQLGYCVLSLFVHIFFRCLWKAVLRDLVTSFLFCLIVYLFVCIQVLRPSQPIRVMQSAVSLPNQTISWAGSVVHILSPKTDNCPSCISGKEAFTKTYDPQRQEMYLQTSAQIRTFTDHILDYSSH